MPSRGYIVEWDVKHEAAGSDDAAVGVGSDRYVLKFARTDVPKNVGAWCHRRYECLPAAPENGTPRWLVNVYVEKTLVVSYELEFDTTILQLGASNGKVLLDNLVVRRLPARQ